MNTESNTTPSVPAEDGLLPCPFCGGTDIEIDPDMLTYIFCNGCEASIKGRPTEVEAIDAWNRRLASTGQAPDGYVLVNIGCIECGVSSAIVGVFDSEDAAQAEAARLEESHGWREGGQNGYEVFPLPSARNTCAPEYASPEQPAATEDRS